MLIGPCAKVSSTLLCSALPCVCLEWGDCGRLLLSPAVAVAGFSSRGRLRA